MRSSVQHVGVGTGGAGGPRRRGVMATVLVLALVGMLLSLLVPGVA
jgi:hypothetical protein